jgi:hypothetical protein
MSSCSNVKKHKPAQKISGGQRRKIKKVSKLKEISEVIPKEKSNSDTEYKTIEVNQPMEDSKRDVSNLKKSTQMKNNRVKKNNSSRITKLILCDKCKEVKPLVEFSNSQLKKKKKKLCKSCIQYIQITSDKISKLQEAFKNNGEDFNLFMDKIRELKTDPTVNEVEVIKKDETDYNDPEVVNSFNSSAFSEE